MATTTTTPAAWSVLGEHANETHTIESRPLPWQRAGLQQTQSGYGARLTSHRVVRFTDGRVRRIYVTCYSNIGTAWITLNGVRRVVRD